MKQTRWLPEFRCLSEYTRLYPNGFIHYNRPAVTQPKQHRHDEIPGTQLGYDVTGAELQLDWSQRKRYQSCELGAM